MVFHMQNTLWQLVRSSDVVTAVVLLILLGMSIFCWTVFLYKLILWRIKKRHLAAVITELKNVQTLDALLVVVSTYMHTLPGSLLSKSLTHLKSLLVAQESGNQRLSEREIESLDHMVAQYSTMLAIQEERLVPYLGVSANVAPLLGLFGTIWGLINAFISISHQHSADITAVAPGIAQALITTIAGLVVAVPASCFFHYLSIQLRTMEQQLVLIGDQFIWLTQTLFYDSKKKDI